MPVGRKFPNQVTHGNSGDLGRYAGRSARSFRAIDMRRTCSECGTMTIVKSFQRWDGRCAHCETALSLSAKAEDLRRPVPTPEEVTEFLRYMDDLNAIRRFQSTSTRFVAILLVAHLLFAVGMAGHFIQPTFGLISWILMGLVFVLVSGHSFRIKCPRCGSRFQCKTVFGFRISAAVSDSCAHCGLRALSQSDFRRSVPTQQLSEEQHETLD